jgi:hypothetical protein
MAKEFICASCGSPGKPKNAIKGSIVVEIILWFSFLIPGLIYSIWRLTTRAKACRVCNAPNVIPMDSPLGQKLQRDLFSDTQFQQNQVLSPPQPSQTPLSIPLPEEQTFRIAQNGTDIGEIKVSEIKNALAYGTLSKNDYFWNQETNQWVALSSF